MIGIELLLVAAVGAAQPPAEPPSAREDARRVEAPAAAERVTTLDCAAARRIVESGPCVSPEGCQAYELWREGFGPPGSRSLGGRGESIRGDLRRAPPTLICPAGDRGISRRAGPGEAAPGR